MAHPRHAEKEVNEAANETARKVAEQTGLAAHTAGEAGAGAAHAGAEMLQRNAEAALGAWEAWIKMVSQSMEQMQQFGRGLSIVDQGAQPAAQSSRNMEPILRSGTTIAAGMQSLSRELVDVARKRLEQNRRHAESLMSCRTAEQLIAAYSDFVRDNLEEFVRSTRRISEISLKLADEAARPMRSGSGPR